MMNVKIVADLIGETRAGVSSSSSVARHLASHSRGADFLELTKPRVMSLAVFTALVGMISAPASLDLSAVVVAVIAIAAGSGAAGALNMWYDADIDGIMERTALRPIPSGRISRVEALLFGVSLAVVGIAGLALATNLLAAALLGSAILFYVFVYTAWLKRSTPQNIVIGGAAGALPPVIGWAAATGQVDLEPITLFVIIFLWTPPHFWALALHRADDYARANVPMLPVVAGKAATKRQVLVYSILLFPASLTPWLAGVVGTQYAAIASLSSAAFVLLALRLKQSGEGDERSAMRLFAFSIFYLFVLFGAMLLDGKGKPLPSALTSLFARVEMSSGPGLWPPPDRRYSNRYACAGEEEV